MRLADIDWRAGRLRLHGKSRRATMLPLPQDAGDALLAYIEDARPVVSTERVFLRVQAPFTPLRSSAEIAGIVARVLKRGGFSGLPTGAHVFRHSLASAWLRDGADLDQIGVALRHASRDTTAIYAKVDVEMLAGVAQPWPGAGVMIHHHVDRYVQLHRALGKKFDAQEKALRQFAIFVAKRTAVSITAELILEWIREAPTPNAARVRFNLARAFAEFLRGEDPRHEAPAVGLMGRGRRRRPAPYILLPDQIARIMAEALNMPGQASISPLTYHHLIGLLASTGLRISEALSLRSDDLAHDGLMVRSGKFGKSRLVPLHASTRSALEQYLAVRRKVRNASDDLFVLGHGRAPTATRSPCGLRPDRSAPRLSQFDWAGAPAA